MSSYIDDFQWMNNFSEDCVLTALASTIMTKMII